MLVSHYAPKILIALFGGLFILAGVLTFGKPLYFDRIYAFILIFTAVICRKNINVLGVVVILVLQYVIEETAWSISELDYRQAVKSIFYFLTIVVYWRIKYDPFSKVLLATLLVALGSEFYWIANNQKAPEIYWHVGLCASSLFIRHLLFNRVLYTEEYFPKKAVSINLDWFVFRFCAINMVLQLLMVSEFSVRSVFGYKHITLIYYSFPYIVQIMATLQIWVIFHESYKLLIPKLLRA